MTLRVEMELSKTGIPRPEERFIGSIHLKKLH